MKPSLKALLESSHLYGGNATFIEVLYDEYLEAPNSVAEPWRDFFDRMQHEGMRDRSHQSVIESFRRKDGGGRIVVQAAGEMDARAAEKQAATDLLQKSLSKTKNEKAELELKVKELEAKLAELEPAEETEEEKESVAA